MKKLGFRENGTELRCCKVGHSGTAGHNPRSARLRLPLFPWTWTSFYPPKPAGNGASCIPLWQPCLCLSFPGDSLEKVHWVWMAQIVKMLPTAQCCPHHASSAHQNHNLGGVLSTEVSSMQLPERRANIAQVGLKTTAILLPQSPGC